MKKELEWVRQNPKGRQAKSKARLARFEELSDIEYQKRNETQEIFIPVAERLGNEVIEFKNVSKAFGDRLLIDNLSFQVPAGAIVGIIGPNGAGKSTLFKLIAGKEQPDSGEVTIGQTVKMAFVDQRRDALANEKTVWEDISGGLDILTVGKFQMRQPRLCRAASTSTAATSRSSCGKLSGGERGRLHLAKTLIAGRQRAAAGRTVRTTWTWKPCARWKMRCWNSPAACMVICHDRWFLDRIATHILAFEGDFAVDLLQRQLPGVRSRQEEGAWAKKAPSPNRVRYKALK